jgi:Ohr subfamily peroxiredoxin
MFGRDLPPRVFQNNPMAVAARSYGRRTGRGVAPRMRNGQFSCTEFFQSTMSLEKVLYMAKTRTKGGRNGESRSSDGRLDIKLSAPGSAGFGTNPEQLFAAGWSACFMGAMGVAAAKMKARIPHDAAVDAEVDLCAADGEYFLQARLNVSLPGLERDVAQALVEAAHETCPYSKATRGNINVAIHVVGAGRVAVKPPSNKDGRASAQSQERKPS